MSAALTFGTAGKSWIICVKTTSPRGVGANGQHQVRQDAQDPINTRRHIGFARHPIKRWDFSRVRHFGLVDKVLVPQPTVMSRDVADMVDRSQPAGHGLPVRQPILGGNLFLVADGHALVERRQQAEVPKLDGNPDRQGRAVLASVVLDEIFLRARNQSVVLLDPVLIVRFTGFRVDLFGEVAVQQPRVGMRKSIVLAQQMDMSTRTAISMRSMASSSNRRSRLSNT